MIVSRYHDISCGHVVSGHTGKCGNLHGHNYRIYFHCAGLVSGDGMVIDFADIKSGLCGWLESNWDHRFLVWDRDPIYADLKKIDGTVCGVPFNPTAENMAQYLIDVVGPMALPSGITLQSVVVDETRKCSAVVSVQPGQDSAQGALKLRFKNGLLYCLNHGPVLDRRDHGK